MTHRGYRFTVASTAVQGGAPPEEALGRLLRQAAAVGIGGRSLLPGRGPYGAGATRHLQAAPYPSLMPVACRGRELDDPRGPGGTDVSLARVSPRVEGRDYRGPWRRHGERRLVYAFRGRKPPSFDRVRETDRRRFAIETTYRPSQQARDRATARDPVRRLSYVGIARISRDIRVG